MDDLYSFDKVVGYSVGVQTLKEQGSNFFYKAEVYYNGTCVHVGQRKMRGNNARDAALKWVKTELEKNGEQSDHPIFKTLEQSA